MLLKLLKRLELCRYLIMLTVFQIPLILGILWVIFHSIHRLINHELLLLITQDTQVIYHLNHWQYVYLSVSIVLYVLTRGNLLNLKQQYLNHLQYNLTIEYAVTHRLSIFKGKDNSK